METLIEPIRYTTTLFAITAVVAMWNALKDSGRARPPMLRFVLAWFALAGGAGLFLSHVPRTVPVPALVPAGAAVGLSLGIAAQFSKRAAAFYAALDDHQWRMLMLLRAVFGGLIVAAGGVGILPIAFAVPAGFGDILVGALATVVPGSLAAGGHRGARALVFGIGLADFVNVIVLQVRVLVPWLVATHSVGISLLLPWVIVPTMVTLNLFGMRQVLKELTRVPVASS